MASFSPGSLSAGSSSIMSWDTPSTAGFGTAMQVGGAASSAIGSYYSGQAQASSLQYQASVADSNARLAEKSAQSALQQGEAAAGRAALSTGRLRSTQRAALASSGVDLGEGSAARILSDTEVMGQLDVNTISANAVRAAWGYRTQGTNYRAAALMNNATADGISPTANATSSLLGSASAVASGWYRTSKVGL